VLIYWRLLSTTFMSSIPVSYKWKVIINTRIGVYTDNFHKCWCFYLLLQDTCKHTWSHIVERK
jgi:hypothetical protein